MVKSHLNTQQYLEKLKDFKLDTIVVNIIDLNNQKQTISVPVDSSLNLMEVVRDAGFEMGTCGGRALCASCHCYVQLDEQLQSKTQQTYASIDGQAQHK